MIDLTGASLVAYLLRVTRDVVGRHPRYRKALGEVTFQFGTPRSPANLIQFGDVQIIIKEVASEGNPLSPDYFMTTQHGRAILAKVEEKDGLFIEFVREIDPGNSLLDPGVYYLNVDEVDEATRKVLLTVQKFKWREGYITNATGSLVFFRTGLDGTQMLPADSTLAGSPPQSIIFKAFPSYLVLYTPINLLTVTNSLTGQLLIPNVDYWVVRQMGKVITPSTVGGKEIISVPTNAVSLTFQDQDGYVLRPGIDFVYFNGTAFIEVSAAAPPGSTITAVGMYQEDPSGAWASVNPENFITVVLQPGEQVTPNQAFAQTPAGNLTGFIQTAAGQLILPTLLGPGENAHWETRISTLLPDSNGILRPQVKYNALKMDMNKNIIPGLWLAIGDLVMKDDQAAILVSPNFTETYEVYGSKENLTFTLEVKSNDLTTSSEISEMLKHWLLVQGRTNMESDGITVFRCSRTQRGAQRDPSGTAPTYSYDLGVTAAADWKEFIPTVTRLISFDYQGSAVVPGYPGKLNFVPRAQMFGTFQFIPWTA